MKLEEIEARIIELKKERDQLVAEVNFRFGAIAELERIKKVMKETQLEIPVKRKKHE